MLYARLGRRMRDGSSRRVSVHAPCPTGKVEHGTHAPHLLGHPTRESLPDLRGNPTPRLPTQRQAHPLPRTAQSRTGLPQRVARPPSESTPQRVHGPLVTTTPTAPAVTFVGSPKTRRKSYEPTVRPTPTSRSARAMATTHLAHIGRRSTAGPVQATIDLQPGGEEQTTRPARPLFTCPQASPVLPSIKDCGIHRARHTPSASRPGAAHGRVKARGCRPGILPA